MSIANAAHCSMMLGAGSPTPPGPAYWGLCFTAEEPNVVVNMTKTGSPPAVTLETSTDGLNWTSFDADGGTTPITLANVGDKVLFRAGSGGNAQMASSLTARYVFTLSGPCAASGKITSLLDAASENAPITASYAFYRLFYNCPLTTAPELPSTQISSSCYRAMFQGCTRLVTAPALPATALETYCYNQMFRGCSSLTTAPVLPATVLPGYCYQAMFTGCANLNRLEVHFNTWNSTTSWVSGVSATGTFYCPAALGTNETIERGVSKCPAGWTVINI